MSGFNSKLSPSSRLRAQRRADGWQDGAVQMQPSPNSGLWRISKLNAGSGARLYTMEIPRFNTKYASLFQYLEVFLTNVHTGETHNFNASYGGGDWSTLFELVRSYNPCGLLRGKDCDVYVAVDNIAYSFLDCIESVNRIRLDDMHIDRAAWAKCASYMSPVDSIGAFVKVSDSVKTQPVLVNICDALLHCQGSRVSNGSFLFKHSSKSDSGWLVVFGNTSNANMLIESAKAGYVMDRLQTGCEAIGSLLGACAGEFESSFVKFKPKG